MQILLQRKNSVPGQPLRASRRRRRQALRLELLERRLNMAFDISFSGSEVSFFGDASNDTLTLDVDGSGFLMHNAALVGNLVSPLDMDSSQAGEQSVNSADVTRISVTGGEGDDTIDASVLSISLYILGGAGNDTLRGGGGNDDIRGGDGDDTLEGNGGDDSLDWNDPGNSLGADVLLGGEGSDYFYGDSSDQFYGGADFDQVRAVGLTSVVLTDGSYSSDGVVSNVHAVEGWTLYGTDSDDTMDASAWTGGGVFLFGGAGNDTLRGGAGNDDIRGGDGDDTLEGNGGDDLLDWNDPGNSLGADVMLGGEGSDYFYGDSSDQFYGGADFDQVRAVGLASVVLTDGSYSSDGVVSNVHAVEGWTLYGTDSDDTMDASAWTGGGVFLFGGAGNDTLRGGSGNDDIRGGDGDDTLEGIGGDDLLDWNDPGNSLGADVMLGGEGSDYFYGDSSDQFYGGADFDQVRAVGLASVVLTDGSYSSDGVVSNAHTVEGWTLYGTDNDDTMDASAWTGGGVFLFGGAGNDTLRGGAGNDDIRGGDGDDTLEGNGGDDFLDWNDYWSSFGVDVVRGGEGDDYLYGGDLDQFYGGEGFDRVNTYRLTNVVLTDTSYTSSSITSLNHSVESWSLDGTDGSDDVIDASTWTGVGLFIHGRSGNDTLRGGSGNDDIRGGDGDDTLEGNGGDDYLDWNDYSSSFGVDVVRGGEGDDYLYGGDLDQFYGGEGYDRVNTYGLTNVVLTDTSYTSSSITSLNHSVESWSLDGTDGSDDVIDASTWTGVGLFIHGRSGNDTLRGGSGNDDIRGGDGDDTLEGNGGDDFLDWNDYWSSFGNDTLVGGDGRNYLYGGPGDDALVGSFYSSYDPGDGANTAYVIGTDGDDVIEVYENSLTINGWVISYSGLTQITIDGLTGNDGVTYFASPAIPVYIIADTPVPILGGDEVTATGSFARSGSFVDGSPNQTWIGTVNYGDGGGDQPLTLAVDKTFSLAHTYSHPGTYQVAVTIQDSGGKWGKRVFDVQYDPLPIGEWISGNINRQEAVQEWRFTAIGGEYYDLVINPNASGMYRPQLPTLNYAKLSLFDSNGVKLLETQDRNPNGDVALRQVLLANSGEYRLMVSAATFVPLVTGEYTIRANVSTPVQRLIEIEDWNTGTLQPYSSPDHLLFDAIANRDVYIDIDQSSNSGIRYRLTGPNGWNGPELLPGRTGPITLPTTGRYQLTVVNDGTTPNATYSLVVSVAPQVSLALATSTSWAAGFVDAVDGEGVGAGNGVGIPLQAGGATIAQSNVNRLVVKFSEHVLNVSSATFELRNSAGIIPITIAYNPLNATATITLVGALPFGKYRLAISDAVTDPTGNSLDGDGSGGAGGIYNLRFNVLPGDVTGNGSVNGADLPGFASAFNSQPSGTNYNPRADWNGDGRVNGADLPIFSANFNKQIASLSEPGAPFGGSGGGSARHRLTDSFFSWFGSEVISEDSNEVRQKRLSRRG